MRLLPLTAFSLFLSCACTVKKQEATDNIPNKSASRVEPSPAGTGCAYQTLDTLLTDTVYSRVIGSVLDCNTQWPIQGASIQARIRSNRYARVPDEVKLEKISGADGAFSFDYKRAGNYDLRITAPDYETAAIDSLALRTGEARTLNIYLEPR